MKKIIFFLAILFIGIIVFNQIILCYKKDLISGSPIFNENIKESKINKNFIDEYIPNKKEFILKGNKYSFNEVWSENNMIYKKDLNKKLNTKSFNISFKNKEIYHVGYSIKQHEFFGGKGWVNDKIVFNISDFELKKKKIEMLFWVQNDTISILFFKKNYFL